MLKAPLNPDQPTLHLSIGIQQTQLSHPRHCYFLYFYFASGRGTKYCDQHVCMCILSASVISKTACPNFTKFSVYVRVAVAQSSDSIAVHNVLPMTSSFHIMGPVEQNRMTLCWLGSPAGGTSCRPGVKCDVPDCLVRCIQQIVVLSFSFSTLGNLFIYCTSVTTQYNFVPVKSADYGRDVVHRPYH